VRFESTIDYPADVHTVAAMLADEEFVRRKVAASGALESSHDILREGDAFTVTTRRQMPTDQVPASFRSLVGQSLDVRLVEAWEAPQADGSRTGTLSLDIVGAPVRVTGRMSLHPAGEGTEQSFAGDVTASIPFFGKPIEKAATDAVDKVLAVERSIGLDFLAGR
jgi:hypothetical protein